MLLQISKRTLQRYRSVGAVSYTHLDVYKRQVVQDMRKGSKWLSAFLESYRPPLDGERYLTDGEVSELLRVSLSLIHISCMPFRYLCGKL